MTATEHASLTEWVETLRRLTTNVMYCNCTDEQRRGYQHEIAKMFAEKRWELEHTVPGETSPRPIRSAEAAAEDIRSRAFYFGNGTISEPLRREMITALVTLTKGDDSKRHNLTWFLFGVRSTKHLSAGDALALVEWLGCRKAGDRYVVSAEAAAEARAILATFKSARCAA